MNNFTLSYFGDYIKIENGEKVYLDETVFLNSKEELLNKVKYLKGLCNNITFWQSFEIVERKEIIVK